MLLHIVHISCVSAVGFVHLWPSHCLEVLIAYSLSPLNLGMAQCRLNISFTTTQRRVGIKS
jgi:hypothetical protein